MVHVKHVLALNVENVLIAKQILLCSYPLSWVQALEIRTVVIFEVTSFTMPSFA